MEVNVKVCGSLNFIILMHQVLQCFLSALSTGLQVKSVFGAKMFALGVVIKIPVPKQTAKTSFQVTSGRAKYNASIDCIVWK